MTPDGRAAMIAVAHAVAAASPGRTTSTSSPTVCHASGTCGHGCFRFAVRHVAERTREPPSRAAPSRGDIACLGNRCCDRDRWRAIAPARRSFQKIDQAPAMPRLTTGAVRARPRIEIAPRPTQKTGVRRRRGRHVRGIGGPKERLVGDRRARWPTEHRFGCGAAARERRSDAFALERVDQPGRVTDEQHPAPCRIGPDHPQLEPPTERPREARRPRRARARGKCPTNAGSCRVTVDAAFRVESMPMPRPRLEPEGPGKIQP